MTLEEVERFFNKYSLFELYTFKIIMNYSDSVMLDNLKEEIKILYKVYDKKTINYRSRRPEEIGTNMLNILRKNKKLNDKEFDFLYDIVYNTAEYLRSIQDYAYAYETVIEDFTLDDYPIEIMLKLEDKLDEEKENRRREKTLSKLNKSTKSGH